MAQARETADDFFLPNLCSPRAVLFLVIVAELFVLVLMLASSKAMVMDWSRLALTSLFVQWIALTTAMIICGLRRWLSRRNIVFAVGFIVLVCLLITVLFTLFSMAMMPPQFSYSTTGTIHQTLIKNSLIALIISSLLLRYFYLQKELLRQQQAELRSRIQSLQSRIQPHFLFNSMNTIASLISTRPHIAEQVVEDLSDLFRASLSDATTLITLDKEIVLARLYMGIELLRMGPRMQVSWHLHHGEHSIMVPRLCLQPILENAVCHGIQPAPEPGEIIIETACDGQQLTLTVYNTLPHTLDSAQASKPTGNQLALGNISDRLAAVYGAAASLHTSTFEQNDRQWYKTIIVYPVQKE